MKDSSSNKCERRHGKRPLIFIRGRSVRRVPCLVLNYWCSPPLHQVSKCRSSWYRAYRQILHEPKWRITVAGAVPDFHRFPSWPDL